MLTKNVEGNCPKCDSEDLDYGRNSFHGSEMHVKFYCLSCDFVGYEVYEIEYQKLLDSEGNEVK